MSSPILPQLLVPSPYSSSYFSTPSYPSVLPSSLSHSSQFSISNSLPSSTLLAAPNITHLVSIKLDSTNYLLWKSQFLPVLISNDLLGYVDSTFPCPPQYTCDAEGRYTPNPAYHAWIRTDQSVRSWLNATLTQEMLLDVHHLSSSHDVWLALERRFVDQSTAKEIQLKYDMQHHKKGTKTR